MCLPQGSWPYNRDMPGSPVSGREAHKSRAFEAISARILGRKGRNCCGPRQYANALILRPGLTGEGPRHRRNNHLSTSRSHPDTTTTSRRPHLVLEIGDFDVRRILVDPGSSADLVQASVVSHMGHSLTGLENPGRILSGFNGSSTTSLGDIILPVQAGPVTLNTRPAEIRFHPDRQKVIRNEIDKLLEAGFIREVAYPDWLGNVVVVPKKEGKWRVCVDYTNSIMHVQKTVSLATNRSNCGFHCRARDALFLGCLLRISPNSHVPG
ncbi:hypothetical protein CK203_041094 [Vitis vinifera]|uniref:Transposon Ty3-I Gag-Pol polyprotein n=1 Tax=Vitis vinifera TaxID=29760 RepID=A0A438H9T3_VITVI|nr:hypothetical protein CK203_041094 [Vitis vinifera]